MNILGMDTGPLVGDNGWDMGIYTQFRKFLERKLEEFDDNYEKVADYLGVSSRAVSYWVEEQRVPRRTTLEKIASHLGFTPEELFKVEFKEESEEKEDVIQEGSPDFYFVSVPYLEAEQAGEKGEGCILSKKIKSYLAFNSHWIYSKGSPKNMGVMRVFGNSMVPTVPDGSIILIDMSRNEFAPKKIFVIEHKGSVMVKRLDRDEHGDIILLSDNEWFYPKETVTTPGFKILGKVIWVAYEVG